MARPATTAALALVVLAAAGIDNGAARARLDSLVRITNEQSA